MTFPVRKVTRESSKSAGTNTQRLVSINLRNKKSHQLEKAQQVDLASIQGHTN